LIGKVIGMDNSTREVEIEVRGKKEKYIVGNGIYLRIHSNSLFYERQLP